MKTSIKALGNLAKSTEVGQRVLAGSLEKVIPYFESANCTDTKVVNLKTADQILSEIDLSIKPDGCTSNELLGMVDQILEGSVMTQHKHFHNQ